MILILLLVLLLSAMIAIRLRVDRSVRESRQMVVCPVHTSGKPRAHSIPWSSLDHCQPLWFSDELARERVHSAFQCWRLLCQAAHGWLRRIFVPLR